MNAMKSVQQTRRRLRKNPYPSATRPSNRKEQREYIPKKVQKETGKIINKLLFRLKHPIEVIFIGELQEMMNCLVQLKYTSCYNNNMYAD